MGGGTDAARAGPLAVGRGPHAASSSMVRPLPTTAIHRLNVNRVGNHQLARPISRMLAGTSTSRTTVVSSSTPMARPMPSSLRKISCDTPNEANVATRTRPAAVMTRAVCSSPLATDSSLSPVSRNRSATRDSMNTS